eukprot:1037937-Lingulodinium_polyedra.AAC.1
MCPSRHFSSAKPGRPKRPSANGRPRSSLPGFNRRTCQASGLRARCSGGPANLLARWLRLPQPRPHRRS